MNVSPSLPICGPYSQKTSPVLSQQLDTDAFPHHGSCCIELDPTVRLGSILRVGMGLEFSVGVSFSITSWENLFASPLPHHSVTQLLLDHRGYFWRASHLSLSTAAKAAKSAGGTLRTNQFD